ncbi:acyltransferase [Thalassotalea profundi]|nr:acyltransferase [Thalassotalea profundi]
MLSFLPSAILMPFSFLLFSLNLAVIGSIITIGGLLKWLIRINAFHQILYRPMHFFYRLWALNNYLIIMLFNRVDWQITGCEQLNKDSWYLLIANHQSWLDIIVLSHLTNKYTAEPKYFLKESLKRIPFLGVGCWALDMPFMKRYSKSFLAKNPHLKGQDIIATRKSCQSFKQHPTTVINFVEGTRFTQVKQQRNPVYSHLLPPKAGGIAFTLATLGTQFDKILNVTILYPDTSYHIMKDVLKGRLTRVIIKVEAIEINDSLIGDYSNDSTFKSHFQQWLNAIWRKKNSTIKHLSH